MPESPLESLTKRVEELERRLDAQQRSVIAPTRDWRSVVGISEETEFSRLMQAEIAAGREADRRAAEAEPSE